MRKTEKPLVTVGLPTRNRPENLRVLLAQVMDQTYTNLEIIISNNASNIKEVDEICNDASVSDPRVIYVKQEKNIGGIENHEFLLKMATADFFVFLGDDDEIPNNYIEECMKILIDRPKVSLVGANGKRYLDGEYWYNYETWDTRDQDVYSRLKHLIPMAFNRHWVFEQYWYGVFRKRHHPLYLSRDFKSTIWRIFHLAANGYIAHTPNTYYIKHTTKKERENHLIGKAYRRHNLLKVFKEDRSYSIQQCVPISFQVAGVILKNNELKFGQKTTLVVYLLLLFFRYPVVYEIGSRLRDILYKK